MGCGVKHEKASRQCPVQGAFLSSWILEGTVKKVPGLPRSGPLEDQVRKDMSNKDPGHRLELQMVKGWEQKGEGEKWASSF